VLLFQDLALVAMMMVLPLLGGAANASALELAMGFEDYGIGAGLRYAFRSVLLSLDEYRSVSAVDGLASWVTSVRLSIDLDRQWRLRLNGGLLRMPAISGGSILYAGLGAAYSW